MKNEFAVFFIRKPDYASIGNVMIPLQLLVTSNLGHLNVFSVKTQLSSCGLETAFVIKNQGHKMVSTGNNPEYM